jgi:hypothetical protein
VLILAVGAVVGVARLVGRSGGDGSPTLPSGPDPSDAAIATATVVEPSGNDGVSTTASASPKADPAARKVAGDFLKAWLRSDLSAAAWHAGIAPFATDALAAKLDGVDPAGVPASRTTGAAEVTPQGVGLVEVTFPVDSGEVRLRVLRVNGAWLVDAVDWERA